MQLQDRFYYGGEWNPHAKPAEDAFVRLSEERKSRDPNNERPLKEILPELDSWPDYLLAHSLSVFWLMEKAIAQNELAMSTEIEDLWNNLGNKKWYGEWLKEAEADEPSKAMCLYMAMLHERFAPDDFTVDFRLYLSEGMNPKRGIVSSLEPYFG